MNISLVRRLKSSKILFLACVAAAGACEGPATPTPPPTAPPPRLDPPGISSIAPDRGSGVGGTAVFITGTGFRSGTHLVIDGTAVLTTVLSGTELTALTPPHAAGAVDVVVENPDRQRAVLPSGFRYQSGFIQITAVYQPTGTVEGGVMVLLTGSGFDAGTTVRFDDFRATPETVTPGYLIVSTPPHAAGNVALEVVNASGDWAAWPGGYSYVEPGSLDIDGTWQVSPLNSEAELATFTIEHGALVRLTCIAPAAEWIFAPAPRVVEGHFEGAMESVRIAGHIVAPGNVLGDIDIPGCITGRFGAYKPQ
jgi:hypothetical protein